MGFRDFWKKMFSSAEEDDDAELRAAQARHGIRLETPEEQRKKAAEDFDPWEELRNVRSYMLYGSWITKKFRPIGEDKVKAELAALEKKKKKEEESPQQEKEN